MTYLLVHNFNVVTCRASFIFYSNKSTLSAVTGGSHVLICFVSTLIARAPNDTANITFTTGTNVSSKGCATLVAELPYPTRTMTAWTGTSRRSLGCRKVPHCRNLRFA